MDDKESPSHTIDKLSRASTPEPELCYPQYAIREALALLHSNEGDEEEALHLVKESISSNPRSGMLHFTAGKLLLVLAIDAAEDGDDDAKVKHLEDGVLSAQLAMELLPYYTPSARLLANLQKELGVFNKESRFEEGMRWSEDVESQEILEVDAEKAVEVVSEGKEDREVVDRRKKQSKAIKKKSKDDGEDISTYKQFWRSKLSDERKREFRKVNIQELENHFKSLDHQGAVDLLLMAIDFAIQNKTWKFWECNECDEMFLDKESYEDHLWFVHWTGDWSSHDLDQSLRNLLKGVWKPINANEVIKFIVNSRKSKTGSAESESSLDEQVLGKNGKSVDNESLKTSMDVPEWEFCDDIERSEVLERIHSMFQLLLDNISLAVVHLYAAILYTTDHFGIHLSEFEKIGLASLEIICLLDAPQLTELLEFFKDVVSACGVRENIEPVKTLDNKLSDHHAFEIKERVFFSKDLSCLIWDELNAGAAGEADGSALCFTVDECEPDVVPDSDDILSWLYADSNLIEGLESWTSERKSKRSQAMKSYQAYHQKLSNLPKTPARDTTLPPKTNAIEKLKRTFYEEIQNTNTYLEHEPQFFMNFLKRRRQELLQQNEDTSTRIELDVISEVLEKAREDSSTDQARTEGCSVEDDLRLQECIQINNDCISRAFQLVRLQAYKKMSILDGINQQKFFFFQKYLEEINNLNVCDLRSIIVPMLKIFLQSCLKFLYKEAIEKSKAAEEALLAEIGLEAKKNINKDSDSKKKNKKNKKRNKNPEQASKSEAIDDSKVHQMRFKNLSDIQFGTFSGRNYSVDKSTASVKEDDIETVDEAEESAASAGEWKQATPRSSKSKNQLQVLDSIRRVLSERL